MGNAPRPARVENAISRIREPTIPAAKPGRPRSIRRRQAPHHEFDMVVFELAPELDLGHIGGLGIALEPLAGFLARLETREAKDLASPGLSRRLLAGTQRASLRHTLDEVERPFALDRHGRLQARNITQKQAKWESLSEARFDSSLDAESAVIERHETSSLRAERRSRGLSSRREGLLLRASHRTGRAGLASGS